MRVSSHLILPVTMAAALLMGCGEARQPDTAKTVRIKLPPAKPAAVEPGFTSAVQPGR